MRVLKIIKEIRQGSRDLVRGTRSSILNLVQYPKVVVVRLKQMKIPQMMKTNINIILLLSYQGNIEIYMPRYLTALRVFAVSDR
eukprot:UN09584